MRRSVLYPPVSPAPEEFVITRAPWSRTLLFRFIWGESFRLRAPDAMKYLMMLGADEESAGKVIDLIWNFRALHYTVATQEALAVPPNTVREVLGTPRRPLPVVGA